MRTLLATIPEDLIAKSIFLTDFLPSFLKKASEYRMVIVVNEERFAYYQTLFSEFGERIEVVSYKRMTPNVFERMMNTLVRASVKSHTNTWSKMRAYHRDHSSFVAVWLKRAYTAVFGGSSMWKKLLRRVYLWIPEDVNAAALFDRYVPDCHFACSLTNFEFEVPLARSSRRRGVPIVGMVRSWDNFSSHGMLRVVPDILLLQNRFLRKMAIEYQGLQDRWPTMSVVGLPWYDAFYRKEGVESRADFCSRLGVNPTDKLVVYFGMGAFMFEREADILDVLDDAVAADRFNSSVRVLYSGHPKFQSSWERAKEKRYVTPIPPIPYVAHEGARGWSQERSRTHDLMNVLYHADVLVMGASTTVIDGAILNKPIVCVGFDGRAQKGEIPYWVSVARFYDRYTHFEELLKQGGVQVASNEEQLVEMINAYLKNPDLDKDGRARIVDEFVAPYDGKAGERLASELIVAVRNLVR